jgi:mannitol/fructose-specific phosphotransferase system IIA component (Ntr-type)
MTGQEFVGLFEKALFLPELQAGNKEEVLREFVHQLYRAGKIFDKEIVLDMLMRRESLGSTAVDDGVAIPHGRTLTTRRIIVAFGRCKKGLDFDARDGKPVHLIFLIVAPYSEKNSLYLPVLGKVAEFCRKEGVRKKLLQVSGFKEFQDVLLQETSSE